MRAALYARVSTTSGQDPAMQTRELRDYCARRGWDIAGEYVDAGVSGSKERRPELDLLLAECRKRQVDAVVVYRYDRFARSLHHVVNARINPRFQGDNLDRNLRLVKSSVRPRMRKVLLWRLCGREGPDPGYM